MTTRGTASPKAAWGGAGRARLCCSSLTGFDPDAGIHVGAQAASRGHTQPPMPCRVIVCLQGGGQEGWDGRGRGTLPEGAVAAARTDGRPRRICGLWFLSIGRWRLVLLCVTVCCLTQAPRIPPLLCSPARRVACASGCSDAGSAFLRGGRPQFSAPQAVCHPMYLPGGGALAGCRGVAAVLRRMAGADAQAGCVPPPEHVGALWWWWWWCFVCLLRVLACTPHVALSQRLMARTAGTIFLASEEEAVAPSLPRGGGGGAHGRSFGG